VGARLPEIQIDGRTVQAKDGEVIIAAAERAGVYIPRFCWHPRMKPVGMCRMCLVEVKGPRGFALQPSCYVPVADGQEIVTTSPAVKKAQDGVLEFLLINHPLDCPVCDRGGECPLQDQTFGFGPGESRFVEEKRHWAKPIPINPLVALDRERCIQCARCTRFQEEVAGDPMIDFVGRADQTEVNIFAGQPLQSNFSANIVQLCPVGALTATPYRFKARPWDLEVVESTCTACAVGCRIAVQSSTNRLVRHLGVDSDPVNQGWLCDKGRFYYEAVDSPQRLTNPLVRKGDEFVEVSWAEALRVAADGLRAADGSVGVLGGARLPNEDAYAWAKLARTVLGTDNVDCQLADGLPAEAVLGLPRATIDEACNAAATLLLCPDLKEELPVLFLRLRTAAIDGTTTLVELTPRPTALSEHATVSLVYRPGEAATVARALVEKAEQDSRLSRAAEALRAGGDVVIVLGRPSVAESADGIVQAAAVLAQAFPGARFLTALRRGNVHGALDMGLAPGVLPGRVSLDEGHAWFTDGWGSLPEARGLDATGMLQAADQNHLQALVLLGSDPINDFPDRALARRALAAVNFTLAVDCFRNESSRHADVILPAAAFGERSGTTTNLEGRVSRLNQKVTGPGTARPDWMIASELALLLGGDLGFDSLESILVEVERLAPAHAGLSLRRLGGDGVVVPVSAGHGTPSSDGNAVEQIEATAAAAQGETLLPENTPDQGPPPPPPTASDPGEGGRPPLLGFTAAPATRTAPPVDAYSLRLVTGRRLYDRGVLVRHSPAMAGLVPEPVLRANPYDLDQVGIKPGQRARMKSPRGSIVLAVLPDPSIPRGTASLDANLPGEGPAELIDATAPVTEVRLESVDEGG